MPAWRIYLFALVVIGMVVSFTYLRLSGASIRTTPARPAPIEQTVITDAMTLEQTNPAFYQGVKDGDMVLRYEDRLELYRPSEERVIRTAPLK